MEQSIQAEAAAQSPAFQFYPKDFLGDGDQAGMSLQEAGAYARLICFEWNADGRGLPDDVTRIARMVGAPIGAMRKMWPALRSLFVINPRESGRIIHPRLEKERDKQALFRRRQSDAGKASAAARGKPTTVEPRLNHGSILVATTRQPEGNSSSSSSSVDQKSSSEPTKAAHEPVDASPSLLTFPTIGAHGAQWHLRETQAAEWRSLFPAVDVLGEARKALAWLQANPTKRKTAKGMPRFLVAWLTRCVDRGGNSTAAVAVGRRVETREETDAYLANLRRDRDAARAEGGSWKFTDVANG